MNSSTQETVNLSDKLLLRVNFGVLGPDAGPGKVTGGPGKVTGEPVVRYERARARHANSASQTPDSWASRDVTSTQHGGVKMR